MTKIKMLLASFALALTPAGIALAESGIHGVPLKEQKKLWSDQYISYSCKELKLVARAKHDASKTYPLSDGLFEKKACERNVKFLKKKGCFCDYSVLKCMQTESIKPVAWVCPSDFICLKFTGEEKGVFKVNTIEDHITPMKCEQELKDIENE